uniref:Uncharacterized protein n=1 Tax=Utricularia reniformis TaxID=192314 RepID=A0A1Y0B2D8_9LAMI|nr:hypothetical protein AEK19_MT1356 [Utricularia reniformis]ART31554.1 hypothetical protein AEK19_MT1356 [Utricularia reniformis]
MSLQGLFLVYPVNNGYVFPSRWFLSSHFFPESQWEFPVFGGVRLVLSLS